MDQRHWVLWIAVVTVLAGCGADGISPRENGLDGLQLQARDALARYDQAILEAGGQRQFVPVGNLTGRLGDWEPTNEGHERTLLSGRVVAVITWPAVPHRTGTVVWGSRTSQTLPLIPADEALKQLASAGTGGCGECIPLEVTGARLSTTRIRTTRGPATVPAWEYTLKGTAVRVTRVAVASSATVKITPPSWDPYNPAGGIAIESATTTTSSRRLTVAYTGAPGPGTQPCGADYSAQAVESANAVVVLVIEHPHAAGETCDAIGAQRTSIVDLAQPLGERAVLEVQQGLPVPLTITE